MISRSLLSSNRFCLMRAKMSNDKAELQPKAVSSSDWLAIFVSLFFRHRVSYRWVSYKSMIRLLWGHLFPREQPSCLARYSACSVECRSSCMWICPSMGQKRDASTCLLAYLIDGDIKSTKKAESWQTQKGQPALSTTHGVSWAKPLKERQVLCPRK